MRNKNFIHKIAITGVIGAGKSTVGLILTRCGMNFISADVLARQAIAPHSLGYLKLLKLLGPEYLGTDGFFDNQKIAQTAFQKKSILYQIESIIHPIVWDLMQKKEQKLRLSGQNTVFYEIPLLFEKKLESFFDTWVVIAIDPEKQKNRLKQYRNLSHTEVKNRMQFQTTQTDKTKKADYVIWNNSSLKKLENQVFRLITFCAEAKLREKTDAIEKRQPAKK